MAETLARRQAGTVCPRDGVVISACRQFLVPQKTRASTRRGMSCDWFRAGCGPRSGPYPACTNSVTAYSAGASRKCWLSVSAKKMAARSIRVEHRIHSVTADNDPSVSGHMETLTAAMDCLQSSRKSRSFPGAPGVPPAPGVVSPDRVPCRTGDACLHCHHAPSHRSQG